MGTRNLTVVYMDKKPVVAQYGQWDGYPDGQGQTVLNFLHKADLSVFRDKLKNVRFGTGEEIESVYKAVGVTDGWMNMEQANRVKESNPQFDRDMAAEVLQFIYDGENTILQDSISFAADSLFCEWAYVIDLDKNTFEVYSGFNKKKLTKKDRFFELTETVERRKDDQYYPVKIAKSYDLDKLPTNDEFLSDFKNEDEDE